MKALEPITGAFRKAGIINEVESPSAEQGAWAVLRLNKMMAALREDGIDLGWAAVSSVADTINLPEGHQEAIESLLAVKLYVDFMDQNIPAAIVIEAEEGRSRLQRQAVLLQNTAVSMRHISPGAAGGGTYDITTGTYI